MALRRTTPMPNASNVAAGTTATFDLPVDRRYHTVWIEYRNSGTGALKTQALIATDITRIDVKLNGQVVRSMKPAWIAAICALHGHGLQDGFIPLYFSEPWQRTPGQEDSGAWQLRGNVSTFQIDVVLAAGAVNPQLKGFTEDDEETNQPFMISKVVSLKPPVPGVGIMTVNQFPVRGFYRHLYLFETAANDIKSVRLKLDNKELYYLTRDQSNILCRRYGMAPQAGMFAVKFDGVNRWDHGIPSHNNVGNGLPGFVQGPGYATTLEFDMAVANTFDLVGEYLSPGL